MRRNYAVLGMLVCIALLFCACSGTPSLEDIDVSTLADRIVKSQENLPPLREYDETSPTFASLMERLYGLDPQQVTEGCLYLADGARAEEVAVLRFTDAAAAQEAVTLLDEYAEDRYAMFAGYAPQMSDMISHRLVLQEDRTVLLIIVEDPQVALEELSGIAYTAIVSAEPSVQPSARPKQVQPSPATAEPTPDVFDHDLVVDAFERDDPSGLSGQNEAVYWAVREFLNSRIEDGMTPYEKELAAHDWIVETVDYDPGAMTRNLGKMEESPFNDTPYGALVTRKAKCYGYSSSFQLLMDILDIPCVTIDGASVNWNRPHSWNAVNLEGQWYLVDVTWDDPVDAVPHRNYLNQTEQYFKDHGPHLWEEADSPEIAASAYESAAPA